MLRVIECESLRERAPLPTRFHRSLAEVQHCGSRTHCAGDSPKRECVALFRSVGSGSPLHHECQIGPQQGGVRPQRREDAGGRASQAPDTQADPLSSHWRPGRLHHLHLPFGHQQEAVAGLHHEGEALRGRLLLRAPLPVDARSAATGQRRGRRPGNSILCTAADSVTSAVQKASQALNERGERLGRAEDKTADMANSANQFAETAQKLVTKYKC
ncbi:uncharacterized protein LOC144933263 isoform X3 [Lampetra fluviatilis]